ncbi:uncharacterized protein LOC126734040 isoform X2 [Anthonomus grandis grandis]|uniref:uncharacterized protein LOC126734040 isoform X2 n=1 Tax=Anthonomus grandis grandis TaxID=2921223 RepID=UPI0021664B97|nr:uncharacterized protein LOC126734040 isoform X2 [Anthonomus grandis grandis]
MFYHLHFLSYLTFLAVKLKIVFFLGTIFTISLVAAKIIGIIKLTEYMKHQHHLHEEKIVYSNPYEHHHDFGGYPGPSDYISSKAYGSYPPDFSADHPPVDYHDTEPYGGGPAPSSGRSSTGFYGEFMGIAKRLRQMNITDMAFKEMGIPEEECRRKFVCKADLNAAKDVVLRIGFDILRDDSYGKYKAQAPVRSEDDCNSLYPKCAT